jgi:hypothetical protein
VAVDGKRIQLSIQIRRFLFGDDEKEDEDEDDEEGEEARVEEEGVAVADTKERGQAIAGKSSSNVSQITIGVADRMAGGLLGTMPSKRLGCCTNASGGGGSADGGSGSAFAGSAGAAGVRAHSVFAWYSAGILTHWSDADWTDLLSARSSTNTAAAHKNKVQDDTGANSSGVDVNAMAAALEQGLLKPTVDPVLLDIIEAASAVGTGGSGGGDGMHAALASKSSSNDRPTNNKAFLSAVERGNFAEARRLCVPSSTGSNGQLCDPHCIGMPGANAAGAAAQGGHLLLLKWLVKELGVDCHGGDFGGSTPLMEACRNNHLDVAQWLAADANANADADADADGGGGGADGGGGGASIHAIDSNGWGLMHGAVVMSRPAVVTWLLELTNQTIATQDSAPDGAPDGDEDNNRTGAKAVADAHRPLNIWRKDGMGRTALDWAEEKWKEAGGGSGGGGSGGGGSGGGGITWKVVEQLRAAWPPPLWAQEELKQEEKAEEERQARRKAMREAKKREKAEEAERRRQGLGRNGAEVSAVAPALMTYDGLEEDNRATNRRTHTLEPESVAAGGNSETAVESNVDFLWGVELFNEEDGQWYDGKASAYNEDSDEITIDIESQVRKHRHLRHVSCKLA